MCYGRTTRLGYVGWITPEQTELIPNSMAEPAHAHADDSLRAMTRHAWIDEADANECYDRVLDLVNEFSQLPRRDRRKAHVFMVTRYPTEHPRLPEP